MYLKNEIVRPFSLKGLGRAWQITMEEQCEGYFMLLIGTGVCWYYAVVVGVISATVWPWTVGALFGFVVSAGAIFLAPVLLTWQTYGPRGVRELACMGTVMLYTLPIVFIVWFWPF